MGLSTTGWEMDREFLVELDRAAWDSVVTEFRGDLPDPVIEDAVQRLPAPYYAMIGEDLAKALKSRRDALPGFVGRYYELITREAEIQATDKDEYVLCEHLASGDLAVRIGLTEGPGGKRENPYFRRIFRPGETREVRIYLRGGDDSAEISGARGKIAVRIDGGGGDDSYTNSSRAGASRTRFFDYRGNKGKGAKIDESPYKRPPAPVLRARYALDWGRQTIAFPVFMVSPDLGVFVGGVASRQYFGYRKDPYSSSHSINAGLAVNRLKPFVSYTGTFRRSLLGGGRQEGHCRRNTQRRPDRSACNESQCGSESSGAHSGIQHQAMAVGQRGQESGRNGGRRVRCLVEANRRSGFHRPGNRRGREEEYQQRATEGVQPRNQVIAMGRGEKSLLGFLGFGILVYLFAISHGGDSPADASRDSTNLDSDTSAARSVVDTRAVSQPGVSLGSYGLKAETAAHLKLPGRLREISGLAMTGDGRLLAHNDERGAVYEIDYRDGSIVKTFQLADTANPVAGDFEGIATAGEQIYLVTSSGRLYEFTEGADRESVLFNAYATGVGRDCEIEGLAYNDSRRELLLMCKGSRSADLKGRLAIYHWSIDGKQLSENPRTVIPVIEFSRPIAQTKFQPSGIERHPASGNYFVVAARQRAIAEITPDGQVLAVRQFPAKWHRQVEGITFAADNTLIVADEGAGKKAGITSLPGFG